MKLFNATQSSTRCYSADSCQLADFAIDGSWEQPSTTDRITGTHWLQVSMNDTLVSQIKLQSATGGVLVTVLLYKGETQVGQCESHPGAGSLRNLSCDELVVADKVKLTFNTTTASTLSVLEMEVIGVVMGKSDL